MVAPRPPPTHTHDDGRLFCAELLLNSYVLKYGGIKLYHTVRPMFLGFILGQISCAAFWLAVDILTGSEGSRVSVFTHHY